MTPWLLCLAASNGAGCIDSHCAMVTRAPPHAHHDGPVLQRIAVSGKTALPCQALTDLSRRHNCVLISLERCLERNFAITLDTALCYEQVRELAGAADRDAADDRRLTTGQSSATALIGRRADLTTQSSASD